MTYSLNSHPYGYALQKNQAFCSLLTCTGFAYGMRHRELAQAQPANWLGHMVLFVIECIPVIGIIAAAIERLAANYFQHLQPSDLSPLPPPFLKAREPVPTPVVNQKSNNPIVEEDSLPLLPTYFANTAELLKETEDYLNNATIPAPLCFPEIDVSALSQRELIETLLKKYNGLCIGEYHNHSSPKYFLTVHMPLFRSLGVTTLYLEGYTDCQQELDRYCAAESADIPEDLLQKILAFAVPDAPGCYTELDVLMAAKKEGIRLVNIDSWPAVHAKTGGILRAAAMNYQAKLIIDKDKAEHPVGKSIIYAGSAHANRIAGVPSLGQIYQFPSFLIRDRLFTTCKGADAVKTPNFLIYKEVVEKSLTDKRAENIDFLIQMDKPIKSD